MAKPQQLQILHISDLHVSEDENFDRSVVLDPLIDRVKKDREAGLKPEIVMVSGDIADKGIRREYELAKAFFNDLLAALELSDQKLFVVPGNHDVNRKRYRKSDIPVYIRMKDLNDDFENNEFRAELLKGMDDYFAFVKTYYKHLKSAHKNLIPFVVSYEAQCGKHIGLVGLNSAWMCRKSSLDRERIALGQYQVKHANHELYESGEHDLVLHIFHHPPEFLWPVDSKRNKQYFEGSILLCGHLHDAGGGYFSDLDGSLYQFQAGGAYLGSESNRPSRFQYITFDWQDNTIRLDFRKFVSEKGFWAVDGKTGDDGKKVFPMIGVETKDPTKRKKAVKGIEREQGELFKNYTASALAEHRHLPMQGFETGARISIEIEKTYVSMRAHIQSRDFDFTLKGRKQMEEQIKEKQLTSLDIKTAFETSKRHNIEDLVILGDPGSGKTTLLKYILVMLIQGRGREKLGLDTDIIPFFAPLRELKDLDRETLVDFVTRVCLLDQFSVSKEAVEKLLEQGNGVILLDGLDEVADETARIRTCKWIDKARKRFSRTRFVVTSRFAGYLGKSRLEGNCLELSIQDFTDDEIETFLIGWFETVESLLHPGPDENRWKEKGRQTALMLVERINKSGHIQKLAVNPLMLQIIALVHWDRGAELPQRRVELYDECTTVLLEKWDMAKGLDVMLTAREAKRILQPLALWLHGEDERRSAPMKRIIHGVRNSLEKMGKAEIDPEALLLNIRDRSGIFMGFSESEYGFTHLSFQEFLAAEHIRNMEKVEILIAKYGQRWWKEVTRLYLALDNPSVIEEFMLSLIPTDGFRTDIGLALDGLNDSIEKPFVPFTRALKNKKLNISARCNAVRALKQIGGPSVIQALRNAAAGKDDILSLTAYEALELMNAANGIKRPVVKDIPGKIISPTDETTMVLIPAGTFLYGSREDDKTANSNEKPQRVVDLPAFYMDVYPVTNTQYCNFLNATASDEKKLTEWIDLKGSYQKEQCRINKQKGNYLIEKGYEKHPVIYVSWHGADAYSGWAGKRLPTEQEWEKAARGTDGFIYPWGDKFDKKLCNSHESGLGGTSLVDRFPEGKSRYGCFDMAGNVWEWTDSRYGEKEEWLVLRGGAWFNAAYDCRCAVRGSFHPLGRGVNVGFRCART